jgi:nicotinamide-nucleotide amidase
VTSSAQHCLAELQTRGQTLATAESLTCGLIAATLAGVPGASAVLRGGLAAYATDVKTSVLGVDAALVDRYGVISRQCAEAMAARAATLFGSDWAVASTGVAGPDSQEDHAVGTVFVAVAGPGVARSAALALSGERNSIRAATVDAALALLEAALDAAPGRRGKDRDGGGVD